MCEIEISGDFNHIRKWLFGDPEGGTEKLREGLLAKTGLSVEKLARAAGLTRTSLYFYLSDKSRPTEGSMIALCGVLGVDPSGGLAQYTPRKKGRPRKNG